jgi:hypothetical protein
MLMDDLPLKSGVQKRTPSQPFSGVAVVAIVFGDKELRASSCYIE